MRMAVTGAVILILFAGFGAVRGSALQSTSLVAIVSNLNAPAELIQADVVANRLGAPETVIVKIYNFSREPVVAVGLEALVFDGDNMLRRELRYPTRAVPMTGIASFPRGALPVGGTVAVALPIADAEATAQWNVAVAVAEVRLASRLWSANTAAIRRQAAETVGELNRRF